MSTVQVRKLGAADGPALNDFLRSSPVDFVYPLGWLTRDGVAPSVPYLDFSFFGAFRGGTWVGASLIAGGVLCFVATHDSEAARAFAAHPSMRPGAFRVLVGPRQGVDPCWEVLQQSGFKLRLARPQVVFAVDASTLKYYPAPELRAAEPADLHVLLGATLDMHAHETLEMPPPEDIPVFHRSVEYQIAERRIFAWTDPSDRVLRFKSSISAYCDLGAQIEGVYVPPRFRRQGFAKRGLSELCHRLLGAVPVVSLYVNEENYSAIELYRSALGFRQTGLFATLFMRR